MLGYVTPLYTLTSYVLIIWLYLTLYLSFQMVVQQPHIVPTSVMVPSSAQTSCQGAYPATSYPVASYPVASYPVASYPAASYPHAFGSSAPPAYAAQQQVFIHFILLFSSLASVLSLNIADSVKPAYKSHPRNWPILDTIEGDLSVVIRYGMGVFLFDVILLSDN